MPVSGARTPLLSSLLVLILLIEPSQAFQGLSPLPSLVRANRGASSHGRRGVASGLSMVAATPGGTQTRRRTVTLERLQEEGGQSVLPVRIDGVWYDLSDYRSAHPGGKWLLDYSYGKDVTAIFKSIHLFAKEETQSKLDKLPIIDADSPILAKPNVFSADLVPPTQGKEIETPFQADLRAMLTRRFSSREDFKAPADHWVRIGMAAAATAYCWNGWLHGDVAATAALPLVHWVLAAHTCHEATHSTLSTNEHVNYWLQFTAHPIMFNVFVWIPQHLISHHQYTNDPNLDVDVHHFAPALLSQEQPPLDPDSNRGWTFAWKGMLTTVGTCILQPMRTLLDSKTPNFDDNITPIPHGVSKATLALSMAPSFFVLLYPLLAFGPSDPALAAFLEVWPWVGMSMIWTAMTQTSHIQQQCQRAPGAADTDWSAGQVETSLDYSVASPFWTAVTGGLNTQSLHHVLPTVCMSHFPDMYREYEEICAKHGVNVRQSDNLATATASMYDFIFKVNAPKAPQ